MIKMFGPLSAILARALASFKDNPLGQGRNGATPSYPIWNTIHQPDSEHLGFLEDTLPPYVIGAKPGVSLKGINKEAMTPVLTNALRFVEDLNKRLVITSGLDGKHSRNSLHYSGLALDIRTRHLQPQHRRLFQRHMQDVLGDTYDVVLEKTHLHIEYDPD